MLVYDVDVVFDQLSTAVVEVDYMLNFAVFSKYELLFLRRWQKFGANPIQIRLLLQSNPQTNLLPSFLADAIHHCPTFFDILVQQQPHCNTSQFSEDFQLVIVLKHLIMYLSTPSLRRGGIFRPAARKWPFSKA